MDLVICLTCEAIMASGRSVWEAFSDCLASWAFPGRFHAANLASMFDAGRKDKRRRGETRNMQNLWFAEYSGRADAAHANSIATHGLRQGSLRRDDFLFSVAAARGGNQSDQRGPSKAFG
eukprot:1780779-Pyramimonas_sp.AAC.1